MNFVFFQRIFSQVYLIHAPCEIYVIHINFADSKIFFSKFGKIFFLKKD